MALTLVDAQTQLIQVNSYISEIYAGTRRKIIEIGSQEFRRRYENADPVELLKLLLAERQSLQDYINTLTKTIPIYRNNSNVPIIVGRR